MANPFKALGGKITRGIARKAWAGTGGAAVGVPAARVIMWLLTDPTYGNVAFPDDIAKDAQTLVEMAVVSASAFLSAYVIPEKE
jgi:hypothetical protein